MENYNIRISVIMPVYNSGKYLSVAIDSILNQDYKNFELILVNDGSTDESPILCDKYAETDKRVRVIHQKNGGICKARNAAMEIAKGEYITFSDHDDEYIQGIFKLCNDIIEKYNPDMVKFGKEVQFVDSDDYLYRIDVFKYKNNFIEKEQIVEDYLILREQDIFSNVWNAFFRNEIISTNKVEFDPYFKQGGEDHDFCNSLSVYLKSIYTIDKIGYIHYIRSNFSTSAKEYIGDEMLYYVVEGRRLYKNLKELNYNLMENKAIYVNILFGSIALPIIRYHIKHKKSWKYIITLMQLLKKEEFYIENLSKASFFMLFKQSKKMSIFSFLFIREHYLLLMLIISLKYKIMK